MRSTVAGRALSKLHVQVLAAIVAGILLGHYAPDLGTQAKPLGDLFIKLIKMPLAPIIFASIVVGVARLNNIHKAGRVGLKAMLWFAFASTSSSSAISRTNCRSPSVPPRPRPCCRRCWSSSRSWAFPSPSSAWCCRLAMP